MKTRSKKGQTAAIRVFLVDDHPLVRRSLVDLVNSEAGLYVCGEASSYQEAVDAVASAQPNVVVVDLTLGDRNGIELVKELRSRHAEMAALVLSMHDERAYAQRALHAGAMGYVMKTAEPQKVIDAIRSVAAGRVFLSSEEATRLLSAVADGREATLLPSRVLSDREMEVFELYGQGCRTRDIAGRLHVNSKTIETYRKRIKKKLGLQHVGDFLMAAMEWVSDRR